MILSRIGYLQVRGRGIGTIHDPVTYWVFTGKGKGYCY